MATLGQVRDGLQTRLATISGLRTHATWPDTVNPPAALVRPLGSTFDQRYGNGTVIHFEIVLVLQLGTLRTAQDALDAYLDPSGASSIVAAIEGDRTLGGYADTLAVLGWHDYGGLEIGTVAYLGVKFDCDVWPV